ncbi:hypothetical protein BT63DRAFT_422847 [Microthyrium microscopicum]|uniref:Uncharacterized protein n=1 Tax=Microthyrium microscopicum TaxID=703497 RepID=A0A6A6UJC2_9PEZI|nr:hypothetical protein BT63DRAFT_422847 [Microthyrium microscopicum]
MGIPYSRQINAAFDQVTPLVAQGFQVLETTKNIAIVLALISALGMIMLGLILTALVALLVTMNPDLTYQRQEVVTPAMKLLIHPGSLTFLGLGTTAVLAGITRGLYLAIFNPMTRKQIRERLEKDEVDHQQDMVVEESASEKSEDSKS